MLQNAIDVGTTADFGKPLSMTSDESSFQPADATSFDLLRMAATLQDTLKRFFGTPEIEQPILPRISEQHTPLLELIEALRERTRKVLGWDNRQRFRLIPSVLQRYSQSKSDYCSDPS